MKVTANVKNNNRRARMSDEARKAYKEEKNARLKKIAEAISKLNEVQKAELLAKIGAVATIEGHKLSPFNTMVTFMQRGNASLSVVGGFKQWKKAGRNVKKGEKGIYISFPCEREQKDENGNCIIHPLTGEVAKEIFYSWGVVFDISQTEPAEYRPDEMPAQICNGEVIDIEC